MSLANLIALIMTFLAQADDPNDFQLALITALENASPQERNQAIALKRHFKGESKKHLDYTEKVMKQVYRIVSQVFPGAYVVYGRKKDFLSYSMKISNRSNVLSVVDNYALRIVLSDNIITPEQTVIFAYRVAKMLIDELQAHNYIILPVKVNNEGKPTEDILNKIIVPKQLDPALAGYFPLFKDYIRFPKPNGYQGIHLVITTPEGIHVEIQIRTLSQHKWAERGLASHDVNYKPENEVDRLCAEKGEEFVKVLATPTVIGKPMFRDTAKDIFPRNEI